MVRLRPKGVDVDAGRFMGFVEGLFRQRRKKTRNALLAMGFSSKALKQLEGQLEPELLDCRPEELSPEAAAEILQSIDPSSQRFI
jgi:16S rRNA A1518/A1519 N6-dimethyltransferase RsmA/KsgA/DIM1 with predicted DNA glycosylase/AP lyase activity